MADISKIKTLDGITYDIKDTVARNAVNNVYTRPMYGIGTSDIAMRSLVPEARANRVWFLPADQIIIEQTTDGGTTWSDADISDTVKTQLFSGTRPSVKIPLLNNARSTNCGLRITFSAMKYNVPSGTAETGKYDYWNSTYVNRQERYTTLTEFWFWLGGNGDTIRAVVEAATGAKSTTWVKCFDTNDYSIGFTGWSGSDWCRFGSKTFGGGPTQTGNYWNWRITLWSRFAEGKSEFQQNTTQAVYHIAGYGESWWAASNNLMKNDHLYSFDYQQNATFPAKVTATSFEGTATTAVNVETQGSATNSAARHIWFSDSSTETKRAHSDNLKYTPSTNTVTANITGTAANVTGIVAVEHGGTGETTAQNAANAFMNALSTGSSNPVDADYYISQYAGGGTTTTTYHRRPMSALWEYIKGKISSVLGLTNTNYGGSSATVNGHTVDADVPSGAKFTDTTYTANTSKLVTTTVPNITSVGSAPTLGTAIAADDITAWTTNTPTSFVVTGEKLSITTGTAASLNYTERSIPNVTSVGSVPTLGTAITVATGSLASNGGGGTVATGISES